jgi:hypothetical protein
VIDRAEEGGADAVRPARNSPVDASRAGTLPTDSPETDDAPADAVPTNAVLTNAVLTNAEQRAAVHRVYRDVVALRCEAARIKAGQHGESAESTDGQVHDAWAQALPGLRASWERHKEKYQERSGMAPRTHPDGTWEADGGRRLTPEQNAEASKACEDIRAEGREVVLPAMKRVEAADQDRCLAGLEHMLKGEDRLKEKIADVLFVESNLTAKHAVHKVSDAVRFTFTYSQQRYAEGVVCDVERLKSEGFELIKLKNLWEKEQYKGINSQWRRPETGLRLEMQFHTPESLEAKELTHKAYERLRGTQVTQGERDELEDYQKRVNAFIVTPPGATEIKEFPRKHG